METIHGSVRLRPTRIGLLVRPTQKNHALVREFIRTCSCLWGGPFNPIIPVCRSLPKPWRQEAFKEISGGGLADAFIRFFEPDVFVEAEAGLAKEVGIEDSRRSIYSRSVPFKQFTESKRQRRAEFKFGLTAFDIYRELYRKDFRFASREPRKVVLVNDPDPFFESVFGAFPSNENLKYFAKSFEDVFKPSILPATAETCLKIYKEEPFTPFHATTFQLEVNHDRHSDGPTVFVFDPNQTVDLIDFWNLRQFKPDVIAINIHWFAAFEPMIHKIIKTNHRPLNDNGVMISTTVEFARSIGAEKADPLVKKHLTGLPEGSFSWKPWFDPIWRNNWRGGGIQPRRAEVYSKELSFEDSPSADKQPSIRVPSIDPEFASRFSYASNSARWVNVIKLAEYSASDSGFALIFPPNVKDARGVNPDPGHSICTKEGIVNLRQFKGLNIRLRVFRKQEAVISWLKSYGIDAEPSSSGRNAEQILNSGWRVKSGRLFCDEGTIKLLDKMARQRREDEDGNVTEYPDRTASVSEWKAALGRRSNALWTRTKLSDFTDANVIRIGLALACPHCAKENWYSVEALDYQLTCERCLKEFPFPQAEIKFNEGDWRYRVIGPYSLPHYADGAYGTILTFRVFNETLSVGDTPNVLSTGLNVKINGQPFEIDFAGWYSEGTKFWIDRTPVVVFGETKSFGNEVFADKDVQRMKALAEKMPGSYVVFSALKKELSSTEKARIRKFAEWGRVPQKNREPRAMVIILTGNELFADHHVKDVWEKLGGRHAEKATPAYVNLDDPWELADLTQQLYLDMPSYWQWLGARRRKRSKKSA